MTRSAQFMEINILANDYIKVLEDFGYVQNNIPEGSTEPSHLLWMLYELRVNKDMSETKKHRWLGFIQGCMIKDGFINLCDERTRTRPILNGK